MDIQSRLLEDYEKAMAESRLWNSFSDQKHAEAKAIALQLYESRQEIIAHVQGIEAENKAYYGLVEDLKEVIAELEAENVQLRDRHIEVFIQKLEEHMKELEAQVEQLSTEPKHLNSDNVCPFCGI